MIAITACVQIATDAKIAMYVASAKENTTTLQNVAITTVIIFFVGTKIVIYIASDAEISSV